jgi:hypothetical protein
MSTNLRLARLAPLAGVAFVAAAAAVVALEGDEPSENATNAELVSHWSDRADTALLAAFLTAAAAVCLLTFAATLRSRLRSTEPGEASSSAVAFAGAIVTATGLLVSSMISFAAADAADQGRVDAVPALNAVAQESWLVFTGGFAAMLLAAGIGGLRSGALPRVLCWAALVLGVAFVTPAGLIAFFATPVWIVATSIVLYRGNAVVAPPLASRFDTA